MENRNQRQPFNPALPIMMVPAGYGAPTFNDGYRRFVQCAKCNKTAKIFICFKGSEKSCNGSENTHTHIDCECETRIKLAGAVQLKTKKDRSSTSSPNTVTLSKEEYEKLKASAETEKE